VADFLKKLKTKSKKNENITEPRPVQTSPLSEDQIGAASKVTPTYRPAQFLIGSGQSRGMQRDHNEDTLYTLSSVIADGTHDLALGICIIADGMGGHKNGDIASGVAARVAGGILVKKVLTHFLDIHQDPFTDSLQEIMGSAIAETHKAVVRYAPGGGTTFTCALIVGEQVTIGHIGDSRGYFVQQDGRIQRITKDHSLVQRMVDLGEINEEQAATHPQRNVILKALGQTENVFPDIQTHPLPKDGSMLFCSDGLWGVVPENEILSIIKDEKDPVIACNRMIESANARGGPDNISVIMVKCCG
jgi:PPM family protein phosphatase